MASQAQSLTKARMATISDWRELTRSVRREDETRYEKRAMAKN
jgi:hypothetical protein